MSMPIFNGDITTITVTSAAAVCLPANSTRRNIYIKSDESNTSRIYLGPLLNITSDRYTEWLDPGDSFSDENCIYMGPYYAIIALGTSAILRITEYF